jgi:hypothetical protein
MKNKKEPHIDETLEKLTELVHSQQKTLDISNNIICMKNQMIQLCEEETALYKKESIILQKIVFWLSVALSASLVVSLLSHII